MGLIVEGMILNDFEPVVDEIVNEKYTQFN